ncbi:MAG: hypothetical protein K2Y20_01145 [Sphingomonas sp.]|nr:hypothetical protein [Sphingomonas sp.]
MIKSGTFLDADVGTLARAAAQGWRWWVDEMAAMLPARLRPKQQVPPGQRLRWDGARLVVEAHGGTPSPGPASILIDPALVLTRVVDRPALPLADLKRLIALDLDRLTPFALGAAYSDARILGPGAAARMVQVDVAAIPKTLADDIADACADAGVTPRAVGLVEADGTTLAADFLAPMRADGLVAAGRQRAGLWWGLVAIGFALNLGLYVYHDIASVQTLQALVDDQEASAKAARKLAATIQRQERRRDILLAERRGGDPLRVLALTSHIMPNGAWAERLAWDRSQFRISGYKPATLNLLKVLRDTGRFNAIRTTVADVATESAEGEPFDISAGSVKP